MCMSFLSGSHAWSFDEEDILASLAGTWDPEHRRCLDATNSLGGLKDFCATVNLIADHWDEGCKTTFEEMKGLSESYLICLKAAECRIDKPSLDPIHGDCLASCENVENAVGNNTVTVTECSESLLVKVGITHEKVCGDSIPPAFYFDFLSGNDFVVLLAASMLAVIMSLCDGLLEDKDEMVMWSIWEVFDIFTSIMCVIWVFISFITQMGMWDLTSHCKFALMGSASMYGPYLYSMNTILSVMLPKMIMAMGGESSGCFTTAMHVIALIGAGLTGGISAVLILCVWVALFISSFWALVAYIHVFILCMIPLVIAFYILDKGAKSDVDDAGLCASRSVCTALTHLMLTLCLASWGTMTYILVSGFLLYFHGDYSDFHDGFFESFTLPPLVWPDVALLTDVPNLFDVWARMLTFDSDMSASAVVGMIVWVHTACLILAKVSKVAWRIYVLCSGRSR